MGGRGAEAMGILVGGVWWRSAQGPSHGTSLRHQQRLDVLPHLGNLSCGVSVWQVGVVVLECGVLVVLNPLHQLHHC